MERHAMKCAKCHGTLKSIETNTAEIDQCELCGGIWFDHKELKHVLTGGLANTIDFSMEHFSENPADGLRGTCPRCEVTMDPVESIAVDGLTYDQCPDCKGVWLDRGELSAVSDPDAALTMGFFADG